MRRSTFARLPREPRRLADSGAPDIFAEELRPWLIVHSQGLWISFYGAGTAVRFAGTICGSYEKTSRLLASMFTFNQ